MRIGLVAVFHCLAALCAALPQTIELAGGASLTNAPAVEPTGGSPVTDAPTGDADTTQRQAEASVELVEADLKRMETFDADVR